MADDHCPGCSARERVLGYFRDHVGDGDVGRFVDGVMEAVAIVAAGHVLPGRESDERQLLIDEIARRFDRAVIAQAELDARGAVTQ